jgi:hypothetical protein
MELHGKKVLFRIKIIGKYYEPTLNELMSNNPKMNYSSVINISKDESILNKFLYLHNKNYSYIQGKIRSVKYNIQEEETIYYKILSYDNDIFKSNNIPLNGKKLIVIDKNILPSKMYNHVKDEIVRFNNMNNFITSGVYKNYIAVSHTWSMSTLSSECNCKFCFEDTRRIKYCFKEIINIVKSIAIREKIDWIWLDSQCVIQDECYSKKLELSSMYSYYASAGKVVAILTLDPINMTLKQSNNIQKKLYHMASEESTTKHVQKRIEYISDVFANEWNTRGWTFQEAIANLETYIIFKGDIIHLDELMNEYGMLITNYDVNIRRANFMLKAYDKFIVRTIGFCLELYGDRVVQNAPDSLLSVIGITSISDKLPDDYPYAYKKIKEIMIKTAFENKDNTLILLDRNSKNEYVNITDCDYNILNNLNIEFIGGNSCKFDKSQWTDAELTKVYSFKRLKEMIEWMHDNKKYCYTLLEQDTFELFNAIDNINNNYLNGLINKTIFEGIYSSSLNKVVDECYNKPLNIWECIFRYKEDSAKILLWGTLTDHPQNIKLACGERHTIAISILTNNYNGLAWCYATNDYNACEQDFIVDNIIRI